MLCDSEDVINASVFIKMKVYQATLSMMDATVLILPTKIIIGVVKTKNAHLEPALYCQCSCFFV